MIKYSVIIPTYNRCESIQVTLCSLFRQSINPKEFEIIVVDDGSIDNTRKIIENIKKNFSDFNLKYIYQNNAGPGSARNTGVNNAKGEIIFFTDDDSEVCALWMEKFQKIYEKYPDIVGIGGWTDPLLYEIKSNLYQKLNFLLARFAFNYLDSYSGRIERNQYNFVMNTANCSYKKWLFNMVGGFNSRFNRIGNEDMELTGRILRLGFPLFYTTYSVRDTKKINTFNKFIRLCMEKGLRKRHYFEVTGINLGQNIFYAWTEFKNFNYFCKSFKNMHPELKYEWKIIFISFIGFFVRRFFETLPFFGKSVS